MPVPSEYERRACALRALIAGLSALVGAPFCGCGTLAAPIEFQSLEQDRSEPESARDSELELEPVEGRPGALVLKLTASFSPDPESRLEIRRRVDGAPPETIRTVESSRKISARIADGGVEFIDRDVEPDRILRYRLLYFAPSDRENPEKRSSVVRVEWKSPPRPPENVRAHADSPRTVELRWEPPTSGALVFRRNVLDEEGGTRRIASLDPVFGGVLVDRDVEPGAVYAYRIALSLENDGFLQYGPVSEPLYVAVPER